ncbi:hypothetical protein CSB08_01370 [Candidatus Gracilibacteria bacterium]|nr:MAG: hypothetical protein CSB08_01370 [Candidatus Gracilibacteria bacterium]PIE85381.1 MAG: hypothetical protein CSA08_02275 [Candidatus Gracilibacteria bacterium]
MESIINFEKHLNNVEQYLKETLGLKNHKIEIQRATDKIKFANRIICCANGSSIPAMKILYYELLKKGYNITFIPPTLFNDLELQKNDLIILCSFGWSRGLIKSITEKSVQNNTHTIVITAKSEKKELYTKDDKRILTIRIFPHEEKLFCRPASSVISYIIACELFFSVLGQILDIDLIYKIIRSAKNNNNFNQLQDFLFNSPKRRFGKRITILTSGSLCSVAENISLALKEGAGIYSNFFDIEDYGHGNYVPDMLENYNNAYIVLSSNSDFSRKQVLRIKKLLFLNNNIFYFTSKNDDIVAGIEFLLKNSHFILNSNKITHFDMNNPIGLKENAFFHKEKHIDITSTNISFLCNKIEKIHLNNKVTIVGISGGSASGKTSLVTPLIKEQLEKKFNVRILNMDNFQMGKDFVEKLKSPYKYDDKRNFCLDEIKESLIQLKQGLDIKIPRFSLLKVARDGVQNFQMGDIILVEGIYATDNIFNDILDFSIYLDDDIINMIVKRVLRYSLEMDLKNGAAGALKQYLKYVLPAHNDIVSLQKKTANVIIKTNFDFGFLINKYGLKGQENFVKQEDIIFCIKNKTLSIYSDNKKCYIDFKGKNYYNFLLNNDLIEVFKRLNLGTIKKSES